MSKEMSVFEALSCLIAAPVMRVDPAIARVCAKLETRKRTSSTGGMLGCWRPKNAILFTLIKTQDNTLVYCHHNDHLFIAHPMMRLGQGCPSGSAFLGHFIVEQSKPRALLFDVVDFCQPHAMERYKRLREMACFFPQPMSMVQWVGECSYLTPKFLRTLPHEVEYVFVMDGLNPLINHRQLSVDVSSGGSELRDEVVIEILQEGLQEGEETLQEGLQAA
jgi:hypothetical protein